MEVQTAGWLPRVLKARAARPQTVKEAAAFRIAHHRSTECVRIVGEEPDVWAESWDGPACRRRGLSYWAAHRLRQAWRGRVAAPAVELDYRPDPNWRPEPDEVRPPER